MGQPCRQSRERAPPAAAWPRQLGVPRLGVPGPRAEGGIAAPRPDREGAIAQRASLDGRSASACLSLTVNGFRQGLTEIASLIRGGGELARRPAPHSLRLAVAPGSVGGSLE
ncbi:hypothetical protein NL676_035021 [Syzygium grande]|nr:hypothetical protein NL676_035021 [Syzygium grande]